MPFDKHIFYQGWAAGEYQSDVRAHIQNGQLKATIALHNETFYLQPRRLHPELAAASHSHVIFPASAVVGNTEGTPCGVDHGDEDHGHADHGHSEYGDLVALEEKIAAAAGRHSRHRRGFRGDPSKTTCEMALVADHRFFADKGQGQFSTTAST